MNDLGFLDNRDISKILKFGQLEKELELFISRIANHAEKTGKSISATQIRNIYNRVIALDNKQPNEVQKLHYKFAFVAAKLNASNKNNQTVVFFMDIIKEIKTETHVINFKMFMEAFVCYHKFYHGTEK